MRNTVLSLQRAKPGRVFAEHLESLGEDGCQAEESNVLNVSSFPVENARQWTAPCAHEDGNGTINESQRVEIPCKAHSSFARACRQSSNG